MSAGDPTELFKFFRTRGIALATITILMGCWLFIPKDLAFSHIARPSDLEVGPQVMVWLGFLICLGLSVDWAVDSWREWGNSGAKSFLAILMAIGVVLVGVSMVVKSWSAPQVEIFLNTEAPRVEYEAQLFEENRAQTRKGPWLIMSVALDSYSNPGGNNTGTFIKLTNDGPYDVMLEPADANASRLFGSLADCFRSRCSILVHTEECEFWGGQKRITCEVREDDIRSALGIEEPE